MSDDDFDFPTTKGTKDLAKVRGKIEEFGKYLGKHGFYYHLFVTPKEMEESGGNGVMPAAASVSMNAPAFISHVTTLMQDSNYRKAALIAILLLKRGRIKIQDLSKQDDGFFSKLKKMF